MSEEGLKNVAEGENAGCSASTAQNSNSTSETAAGAVPKKRMPSTGDPSEKFHSGRNQSSGKFPDPRAFSAPKTCRYFAETGRCRFMENCKFAHISRPTAGHHQQQQQQQWRRPEGVWRRPKQTNNNIKGTFCTFVPKQSGAKNADFAPPQQQQEQRQENAERKVFRRPKTFAQTQKKVTAASESLGQNSSSKEPSDRSRPTQSDLGLSSTASRQEQEQNAQRKVFRKPRTFAPSQKKLSTPAETLTQPGSKEMIEKSSRQSEKAENVPFARPNQRNFCQKRSEVSDEELKNMHQADINFAKKRFPEFTESDDGKICVNLEATDPDWPFDVKSIMLELTFPDCYPWEPLSVHVLGPDTLPELLLAHLTRASKIYLQAERKNQEASNTVEVYLRKFIRWLDRQMETLFVDGLRKVRMDLQAKAAGITLVTFDRQEETPVRVDEEEKTVLPESTCSADDLKETQDDSELSESETDFSSAEDGDGDDDNTQESRQASKAQQGGIEVRMAAGKFSETVAAIFVSKITIVVQCERCRTKFESTLCLPNAFRSESNVSGHYSCAQCHVEQSVVFQAGLLHQNDHLFGHLWTEGCVPVDLVLLTSEFNATCFGCNKDTQLKGLSYGFPLKTWCRECNTKLEVQIEAIRFVGNVGSTGFSKVAIGHSEIPLRMKKAPKDPRIQEGLPLPENGACKHYKKSFRWLRFPCCGKAYACDVCHEENETHEMKFANRMICGFCAKEQVYQSSKPCVSCGGFVTKARTSHWEGGKGCRDTNAMSKNDRAKYVNTNKTVSKHKQQTDDKKKKKKPL